ncbi:GD22531 [Drosophila simulans]|uniref:GD22531 n=1 Tax=Drosophila simulans TaxID=7240 RepID=B4NV32_DROSI|nr:GD22531 [Drosophila simulans]
MAYTEESECYLAPHPAHRSHTLTGSPGERARTKDPVWQDRAIIIGGYWRRLSNPCWMSKKAAMKLFWCGTLEPKLEFCDRFDKSINF